MEQVVIRRLKDGTLADYRRAAEANGRSLEAELREVVERHRPPPAKDAARLIALSERLRAATLKPGGDSTPFIRWSRDTNAGRLPGSAPFEDGDAGR
jgi:plasmid stability protein